MTVNANRINTLEVLENVEAVAVEKVRGARIVGSVQNILDVFDTATQRQVADGVSWYSVAHEIALDVGDGNLELGAGLLAALSPQVDWAANIAAAYEIKLHGYAKKQTYTNNEKAKRILAGEKPLDVLGGKKVRAFYEAIRNPHGTFQTAVIDRHAVSVWAGYSLAKSELPKLQLKGQYETVASDYAEAASLRNVTVHTMQSVTWVAWREAK